jgi:hypothetical protein
VTRLADFCLDERAYYPASVGPIIDLLEVGLQTLQRVTEETPQTALAIRSSMINFSEVLWKFNHKFNQEQVGV